MTDMMLIVVAAALIDVEGRVLVQQRPPGKSLAGLWEFPGGKVEPGEGAEAALVRELAEELGVVVDEAALTPVSFAPTQAGGRPLVLLLYRCAEWRGEPRALDAVALCWADRGMLATLPMPAPDVPLAAALAAWLA
ncbi:8-oxo-dGTP diphosphatase [Sphingomonas jinjuensis]|uniref:8-oxo-dGTP diphosphatase n=1 Tax=Sphingomonas jinjuensis TaxID=535907 RepID=A0A840F9X8_9SPHN|nr:(deoxy)nucleoside triphosphate pyrophosphohydrolase [Sphingomonas jinjuensis]MBB4153096.1 8-oxo-dGTP diphosphatase [Sphingomonas jinjuensis]